MFMEWKFRFAIWVFNRWARPFRHGYRATDHVTGDIRYYHEGEVDEVFI